VCDDALGCLENLCAGESLVSVYIFRSEKLSFFLHPSHKVKQMAMSFTLTVNMVWKHNFQKMKENVHFFL
jgi:hypothetical protein